MDGRPIDGGFQELGSFPGVPIVTILVFAVVYRGRLSSEYIEKDPKH